MSFRNIIVALSTVVALVAPAATAAAAPAQPATAPAAARPVGPDADFLIAAHQGNLAEIKAGRIAARRGDAAAVRSLGQRLAAYHRKLDGAVVTAARKLDVRLPNSPNSEQLSMIRQYRTASAAEFDGLFVASQLLAHQHAIKLGRIVLATGTEPAVRQLVTAAVPVVRKHHAALVSIQRQTGDAAGQ